MKLRWQRADVSSAAAPIEFHSLSPPFDHSAAMPVPAMPQAPGGMPLLHPRFAGVGKFLANSRRNDFLVRDLFGANRRLLKDPRNDNPDHTRDHGKKTGEAGPVTRPSPRRQGQDGETPAHAD